MRLRHYIEMSGQFHDRFTPGVRASCARWLGDRVDPRASLDAVAKRKHFIIAGSGAHPTSYPVGIEVKAAGA